VPTQEEFDRFVRHNEAARAADLAADKLLTMSERLEQAAELSRLQTQMREGLRPHPDAPGR